MQQHPAATAVLRLNDPPGGIFGLAAGTVGIYVSAPGGPPVHVHQLSHRGWAGVVSFLDGAARRTEYRTVTECVLMHLPLAQMERMAAQDEAATCAFARIAVGHIDSLLQVVADLMQPDTERRVAATLLRTGRTCENRIPLTQGDIAMMANVSRRQTVAALRRFQAGGLEATAYRSIRILDPEGLRAFVAAER